LPVLLVFVLAGHPLPGEEPYAVELVVSAGRPLRVALDARLRIRRVGQPVTGTLVDPVYAYDRIVLPAGITVVGRVEALEGPSAGTRVRALLRLDFSPPRRVRLRFDGLVTADGTAIPIQTDLKTGVERLAIHSRSGSAPKGVAGRAGQEVADRAKQVVAAVKEPGRGRRLKESVVGGLPFHPQYLQAGTVYTAVLSAPLAFGTVNGTLPAEAGDVPAPESLLRVRLLTPLDSATARKGSLVQAAVIEPVFSADHRLILPEGTLLSGEVTFAKSARRFHRNGQLRFLFESVKVPEQAEESLRASLYSVQAGRGERLALDEEGGATIVASNKRFIAPALGAVALAATLHSGLDYNTDGLGPEVSHGLFGSGALGGFLGFGLAGAGLSQLSHPMAVGLGAVGLARNLFGAVAGRGRNVSFPADTVMEVQLAPAPLPEK
jgi:hypothetical protein